MTALPPQQIGTVSTAARDVDTSRAQSSQAVTQSVTGQVVGAIFALCAFSVAVLGGLYSGNSATSVVGRALLAMIVCYPIGLLAGYICQRVLQEHLRAHVDANPVPDLTEQPEETDGTEEVLMNDMTADGDGEEVPIVV